MTNSGAHISLLIDQVSSRVHWVSTHVNGNAVSISIMGGVHVQLACWCALENSHDFMNVESLTRVRVKLGHKTAKLSKLAPIESHDTLSVDEAAIFICEESLHGHLLLVFVQEPSCLVSLLEAAWIIFIGELEGSLKLKRAEVEFFDTERSGETASAVKITSCEKRLRSFVIDDASSVRVDTISTNRNRLAFQIIVDFLGHIVIITEFNDQVSFIITFELSNDIDLIEIS